MKKIGNSSNKFGTFLKTELNRIKNSFKKPSKKAFGKIGLFLIFGTMILNLSSSLEIEKANALDDGGWFNSFVETMGGLGIEAPESASGGAIAEAGMGGGNLLLEWALSGVNSLMVKLVSFSGSLIDRVLQQSFYDSLIRNNTSIYKGWTVVRDILNMFFMLLLLFSAFATIFQVEKYHLRKMIIMLVVMALLVNFSFPIARFIIDFSNSAMYFLIELTFGNVQSDSGVIMRFANVGAVLGNINGGNNSPASTQLMLSIIFNFIIFITFISIGLNLLIRIIAFIILLILAPAGFAFNFFPDTKSLASDWWSALFKYAFMGPVMVFFIYLAVLIFDGKLKGGGNFNENVLGFIVPIVFLWIGLIASQKFGGDGAGAAMNLAKKTGNKIKGYGQSAAWTSTKAIGRFADDRTKNIATGSVGAIKMKLSQWNNDHKSASNTRATQFADKLGVAGANEKLVQSIRKDWKDGGGVSDADLIKAESGSKAEKMAAALERAENKGFDKDPDNAFKQYQEGLQALEGNKVYKELFERNIKKKNIDLIIRSKYEEEKLKLKPGEALDENKTKDIAKKEFAKLNPAEWKDQNIERINITNTKFGNLGVGRAAGEIIDAYKDSAKNKLMSEINGEKYAQGKAGGLWV